MTFEDQAQLAAHVEKKLRQQTADIRTLLEGLSTDQRQQPRADGGWSIDQILSHLTRMNETYLKKLESVGETDGRSTASTRWTPTLGGRMLRWGMTATLPMKTPRVFQPDQLTLEGDPIETFVESQNRLLAQLDRLRGLEWDAIRLSSPATSLLKVNVGDVFLVLAMHVDRHLEQLERQRDAVAA